MYKTMLIDTNCASCIVNTADKAKVNVTPGEMEGKWS